MARQLWYRLEGKDPVATDTPGHLGEPVGKTTIGAVDVSTVFLGLDHGYGDGPPVLFETMVFGGPLDGEQVRYKTWEQAEAGHTAMVQTVQAITSARELPAPDPEGLDET